MEKNNQEAVKPRKVRGTATYHDDTGDMEFRAVQPGEPVQKNVRKSGESSFYETEGKGRSSYVCHLKVDRDSADPAAEMDEQLQRLTASIRTRECAKPRGKRLMEKPGVTVYHNRQKSEVSVLMTIDLASEGELSAKLFNLTAEVNKCFAINRTSLTPPKK